MRTVSEIFEALGGSAAVSRMIDVKGTTASEMRRRGKIPSKYWVKLVRRAHAIGPEFSWLTCDYLAEVDARESNKLPGDIPLASVA